MAETYHAVGKTAQQLLDDGVDLMAIDSREFATSECEDCRRVIWLARSLDLDRRDLICLCTECAVPRMENFNDGVVSGPEKQVQSLANKIKKRRADAN